MTELTADLVDTIQSSLLAHGCEAVYGAIDWAAVATEVLASLDHPNEADALHDAPIEITCSPEEAILAVSAETVEHLDALGRTLAAHYDWQIDIAIGWTPADTIHLTARPRHDQETAA